MKKILLVYLLLIVSVGVLALMRGNFSFPNNPFKKSEVIINNKTFTVGLAKSEKEKMTGLSGRNSLDENSGMLFIFSKKDTYSFWMKEMKFPIDIIFIDTDKVVDVIQNASIPSTKNVALLPIYKGAQPANYVLEIKAGAAQKNKIKIGDKVTIKQ
ncbi:MAG: DUF192 domain-containing protein [Sulfurimonas sp.]|nr:DUF192 domain-containing protein [Sulfurimonas sp.]